MATTNDKNNKTCSKCRTSKERKEFVKDRNAPDGLCYQCKVCCKAYRLARAAELSKYQRAYRQVNSDKLAQYRRDNAARQAEYNRAYKPKKNAWIKQRRQADPVFRVTYALRTRLHDCLVRKHKASKNASTMALLGMNKDLVRRWLEFQFEPGMSWDNYGIHWEIDHVLPVSRFDVTDPKQQRLAFHWTNIQPARKEHNRSKRATILLHEFFNTLVSAHRFIQNRGLGRQEYQALRESVAWLRATI